MAQERHRHANIAALTTSPRDGAGTGITGNVGPARETPPCRLCAPSAAAREATAKGLGFAKREARISVTARSAARQKQFGGKLSRRPRAQIRPRREFVPRVGAHHRAPPLSRVAQNGLALGYPQVRILTPIEAPSSLLVCIRSSTLAVLAEFASATGTLFISQVLACGLL